MTTRRCIYCLNDKPETAFNREHVIPQAFGKFDDNLVLECVCKSCNDFFGETIDLKLSRDSMEGFHRFRLGLLPPHEFKTLGKRSTSRVEVVQDGPMKGVICKPSPSADGTDLGIDPLPQVGFSKLAEGPFEFFLLDQIPSKEDMAKRGFNRGDHVFIRVWGTSMREAQAALVAAGYGPGEQLEETPPPQGRFYSEHVFRIAQPEFRAVAKIAFNYFAKVTSDTIALMPQFNDARFYIRWDNHPTSRIVDLGPARQVYRRSTGQPVVCHYLSAQRIGSRIVGQVSLFRIARYVVTLSPGPFLTAFPLSSAHLFDVETRKISAVPVEAVE